MIRDPVPWLRDSIDQARAERLAHRPTEDVDEFGILLDKDMYVYSSDAVYFRLSPRPSQVFVSDNQVCFCRDMVRTYGDSVVQTMREAGADCPRDSVLLSDLMEFTLVRWHRTLGYYPRYEQWFDRAYLRDQLRRTGVRVDCYSYGVDRMRRTRKELGLTWGRRLAYPTIQHDYKIMSRLDVAQMMEERKAREAELYSRAKRETRA